MEREDLRIPQFLHRPYQVLFFEADELACLVLGFVFILFFGLWMTFLLVGLAFFLSWAKKRYPRGYLRHMLYKIGLVDLKNAPTYFENKFND